MANVIASAVWKSITSGKGFDRVLEKVKIVSASEGQCVAELVVDEEHTNFVGTMHGGYTATLVDVISSVAVVSKREDGRSGVSVDLHISYLKAAKIGKAILIEAKTNKLGRNLAFLDVVLKDKESGQLIATGTHTKFVG